MSENKKAIFTNFVIMIIACFMVGVTLGPVLTDHYFVILIALVLCIIALYILGAFQNKMLNYIVSYLTVGLLGVALFATVTFYAGSIGTNVVALVIISSLFVFGLSAIFGWNTQTDVSSWGRILTIGLIGLIAFSVVTLFVFPGNWVMALSGGIGVALFVGYTIYDINTVRHYDFEDHEVPIMALSLFLNLYNLIVQAIKAIYYFLEAVGE